MATAGCRPSTCGSSLSSASPRDGARCSARTMRDTSHTGWARAATSSKPGPPPSEARRHQPDLSQDHALVSVPDLGMGARGKIADTVREALTITNLPAYQDNSDSGARPGRTSGAARGSVRQPPVHVYRSPTTGGRRPLRADGDVRSRGRPSERLIKTIKTLRDPRDPRPDSHVSRDCLQKRFSP